MLIFKKGQKHIVENYPGVAIESALIKFLESLVNKRLTTHVKEVLAPEQHGLMKGRSTMSNVVQFNHYVKHAMESMYQEDVLYIDLFKAFDRASHYVLSVVFDAIKITPVMYVFLMSYLSDRLQAVKLMMGFVRRNCVDFRETSTLQVLFGAYIRSHVKHAV